MTRWYLDRTPQAGAPTVNLRRLLPEARFVGAGNGEISGYAHDSRRVGAGEWSVTIREEHEDGAGDVLVARAVEWDIEDSNTDSDTSSVPGRLQVVVGDARSARARISHALAGEPARALPVVGVTGASGKSAVGAFLRAICRADGQVVGSVGTASWFDGDSIRAFGPEAPDSGRLAAILAAMVHQGCGSAVLEVAAGAIDRREVDGIPLAAAVVTGLGDDDAEARSARRRSFARLVRRVEPGGSVIIDADDPDADVLGAVNLGARRVTFALVEAGDAAPHASVAAVIDRVEAGSARFLLRGFDRDVVVTLRVGGGRAVVRQALAAAAVAWSQGISADAVVRGLESVGRIPGRFEPVRAGQPFEVRVDQARTAGDLARALAHLRAITPGRVLCVIGARGAAIGEPGSYDQAGARAALGRAAEAGADLVILTAADPRNEDPNGVADEILAGMVRPGRVRIELDRCAAIAFALLDARPGDGVLIAGKGAHAYQAFAGRVVPFDDAAVADQILRDHRVGRASA